jgi:hypothetical protein
MSLSKSKLNDYRIHAITVLTAASTAMTQIDSVAIYAGVASGLAFLFASSTYTQVFKRVDDLVDELEESGIISEDMAEDIEEAIDVVEKVVDVVDGE